MAVIGREQEQALIDGLLRQAFAGDAGVLTLVGEPGIGKTVLCDCATSAADGMTVVRLVGVEFESDLLLSGVLEVMRPLRRHVDRLPEAARLAAMAVLGGKGQPGSDRFALASAVLELLSVEAEERPVLVVVDDAHWVDELSGQVLGFAFRRLQADAVAVLVASRRGEPSRIVGPWPEVVLSGLNVHEVRALIADRATGPVTEQVVAEVAARTGGNPLAITEAVRLSSDEELSGARPLADPLPLGERGMASFGARLADLPATTREAMLIVAVAGSAPTAAAHAALVEAGVGVEELEAAERAGLITAQGGSFRFSHPLVRAAAVATADNLSRRQAHAVVARALVGADVERRAWHLAAAAPGPSDEIADALAEAADNAARRGGPPAAATSLMMAAHFSPAGAVRIGRLARAGEALFLAGRRLETQQVVDELLRVGDSQARVAGLVLTSALAAASDSIAEAPALMLSAFNELAASAPDAAFSVGMQLWLVLAGLGTVPLMAEIGEKVLALPVSDQRLRVSAEYHYAHTRLMLGDRRPLEDLERRFSRQMLLDLTLNNTFTTTLPVGWVWAESFGTASWLLTEQISSARSHSAASLLPLPLITKSDLECRTGELFRARTSAEEGLALCELVGGMPLLAYGNARRARVAALEGDAAVCREQAHLAFERASQAGTRLPLMYVNHALGLLELASMNPEAAADHLARNAEAEAWTGLRSPIVVPWKADYVEALIGAGRTHEAEEVLDDLERQGQTAGSVWALGAARRCRVLLGEEDWESEGEGAVADLAATPIEQARAHLILGERLRRNRQPRSAREHLGAAAQTFHDCGALLWARRAERAFQRAGGPPPRTHRPATPLTAQELQVCQAAADGATNKEIAAALFISAKTVECHLQHAFAKLGASNRTQAARLLAEHGGH